MSCNTGDLILFSGSGWISSIIEYLFGTSISHVGIVIRDPPNRVRNLYQLNSSENIFLLESTINSKEFGVSLVPLGERIINYQGKVYIRYLRNFYENEKVNEELAPILGAVYDHVYDYYPNDLLACYIKQEWEGFGFLARLLASPRHTDKMFCSALASYCYAMLGLIDYDTDWSYISPEYFQTLEQLNWGASLSKLYRIKVTDNDGGIIPLENLYHKYKMEVTESV